MKQSSKYEKAYLSNKNLPIEIRMQHGKTNGELFYEHYHEQFELLYFTDGAALVVCDADQITVQKGDLIVINSNQVHRGEAIGVPSSYTCIIMDMSFVQSSFLDLCELKFFSPIIKNNIMFVNHIKGDKDMIHCVHQIANEYAAKELGYEIAVKSWLYRLFVILIRKYIKISVKEPGFQKKLTNIKKLEPVMQYLETHYDQDDLSIYFFADMIGMSTSHFCHIFNETIGLRFSSYINHLRVKEAEILLKQTDMNVTEAAMAVGFNDANYFCRVFKRLRGYSPSSVKSCIGHN